MMCEDRYHRCVRWSSDVRIDHRGICAACVLSLLLSARVHYESVCRAVCSII